MGSSRDQRFCRECGQRMVRFETDRYPNDEWLGCPAWLSRWRRWFGDGLKHDIAIIGERQKKFDPVTGEARG